MRKPPLIVFTIIVSAAAALLGLIGLFDLSELLGRQTELRITIADMAREVIGSITTFAFAAGACHACFRRPRWGHTIAASFVVMLAALFVISTITGFFHPGRQVPFPSRGAAEQVGVYVGQVLTIVALLAYARAMVFGKTAKSYFFEDALPRQARSTE
jgi:hypothetical protein